MIIDFFQASYLIGVSDTTSTKGTAAIVDQSLLNRSVTAIRHACSDFSNPSIDRDDVCIEKIFLIFLSFLSVKILNSTSIIAKNTSILCGITRDASINTTNPTSQRRFVQSAKDIANATAELVRKIKVKKKQSIRFS